MAQEDFPLPFEIQNPKGLRVKELIKFLEGANPESVVIFRDEFTTIRFAQLEVGSSAHHFRPEVHLSGIIQE